MAYEYVKRTYGVEPIVGNLVEHAVTKRKGNIADENPGQAHYVMVRFMGTDFATPCHPTELYYYKRLGAVPAGVYWSREAGNFYDTRTNKGMGVPFYEKWQKRKDDFPEKATSAAGIDIYLNKVVTPQ